MKAYSADLRHRIVAAVDGGVPRREVVRTFQVSLATIKRYLKQRRETGHLAPRTSPGRPPDITAAQFPALEAQLTTLSDATLAQHCQAWQQTQGQVVSVSAMRRAISRVHWTHKKSPWPPWNAMSARVRPGAKRCVTLTRRTWSSSTKVARISL